MKPIFIENKWYIEVPTEEFGNVLLLKKNEELPLPLEFESEKEALNYIESENV